MLKEHDRAVLLSDIPEHGLKRGDVGTIVMVHSKPGYEMEFINLAGKTVAIVSVFPDQVRPFVLRDLLLAAPLDDEPESQQEMLMVSEAYEDVKSGDIITDEELNSLLKV